MTIVSDETLKMKTKERARPGNETRETTPSSGKITEDVVGPVVGREVGICISISKINLR